MEHFDDYSHALASIALMVVLGQVLAIYSALKKNQAGVPSGGLPTADYGDPTFRASRAFLNATEQMGMFVGATVAAILVGASPVAVNLLASVFVLSRIIVAVVHIRGIGKADNGVRSIVFTIGWLCSLGLAGLALWGALT